MGSTPAVAAAAPPRRYDPPHILWYFGAITAALAADALIASVSPAQRGIWQLLVGIVLMAGFAGGAALLLQRGRRVPGGVLVATAVALVPTVGQAFERLIGVWPGVVDDPFGLVQDFQGALFALGFATILAGLAAYALVRFPFVFLTVTFASLVTAQFLVPVFVSDGGSIDDHMSTFIVTGAVLLLVGLVLDSVGRRDDAFWWHVIGLLGLAVGLTWYAFFRHSSWAWVTILVLAAVLLVASAAFHRATWATFGVAGIFGGLLHYVVSWTGSWKASLLMLLVAVGLLLLGIVLQLYSDTWSSRLRRPATTASLPPPGEDPPV